MTMERSKVTVDRQLARWLVPGLGVKRWLILMITGMALIGLGIGYVMVQLYRNVEVPDIFYYITLQFMDRWIRAVVVGSLGITSFVFGFYFFIQSILRSVRTPNDRPILDKLWEQRIAAAGPKIVAIGGGHGLSALLRGIKKHTTSITAIVTVADDGGSSGRLRRELGVLPPGDFRMCIAALADDESMVTQLFQYRFGSGAGLSGHSFGNLFIAALAELTGSFERAVVESSKVMAIKGRIVPSTLQDVTLCAELIELPKSGNAITRTPVRGESSIGKAGYPIERVWLEPNDPPPFPDAVKAILDADIVVMGPGSLFTSVMPNLLVPGILQALRQTSAKRIYVANVATERGETDRFSLDDHLKALEAHIGHGVIDIVIANNHISPVFQPPTGVDMVLPEPSLHYSTAQVVLADVTDDEHPWRHDSQKLAAVVMSLVNQTA